MTISTPSKPKQADAMAEATGAPSGSSSPATEAEETGQEDEEADIPLTMAASVVLADLPQTAASALEQTAATTGPSPDSKVVVRFKAVGSAPPLAQDVCKISSGRRFEEVVRYLRRKLRCKDTDSVFLYVNSSFAPSLDEVVGNLHQVWSFFLSFFSLHPSPTGFLSCTCVLLLAVVHETEILDAS